MMIQKVVIVGLLFAGAYAQVPEYILTAKNSGENVRSRVANNKVSRRSVIGGIEFAFVSNLTNGEKESLSQRYVIEKNEKVQINWHLDRVDQRNLPLDGKLFQGINTNNIDIYVVDTGVDIYHNEFKNNNPIWGNNFADSVDTDCNGHGTHVASLILGTTFGAAKSANLIAVKTLDCSGSGSYSGIIAAIEWVTNRVSSTGKLSVVNMSLGGPRSTALDTAIKSSYSQGVYHVVAAGNSNADACYTSPARVPEAITVAASDINDYKASFSNYGKCVDVYAPGVNVYAAWPNNQYVTLSGTSMASPVACGVLATYLSRYGRKGLTVFNQQLSLNKIIRNPRRTFNRLVYYS